MPRDNVEAYKWCELAAAQDHDKANVTRDLVLVDKMTPAEISKAQRLAREWTAKYGK